eukprot:760432-Hanusia_phi.AAC.2
MGGRGREGGEEFVEARAENRPAERTHRPGCKLSTHQSPGQTAAGMRRRRPARGVKGGTGSVGRPLSVSEGRHTTSGSQTASSTALSDSVDERRRGEQDDRHRGGVPSLQMQHPHLVGERVGGTPLPAIPVLRSLVRGSISLAQLGHVEVRHTDGLLSAPVERHLIVGHHQRSMSTLGV